MEYFNRQYRVQIGKNGTMGKEIGKPDPETGRSIRCQFSCEIGDSSASNTGKITLWNLSDETLRLLDQEACLIELRAGYGDDLPVIMGGSLVSCVTSPDGADSQTEIEFVDGFKSARDNTLSLSYSGSVNGKKIVEDAAKKIGCEVRYSNSVKFSDLKNFAFVGNGKTLIGKICNKSGLRWSVQNGIVQICTLDEPITTAAYRLAADTGLIGSPKPVYESSQTSNNKGKNSTKRKAKKGLEIEYLLNGHILIDDYIKLESRKYSGNYRMSKIAFDGDTEGGDWICKAQIVEVK
jgi:hypothetical protein|nr:MAG TPA: tail protein [Caudoviricetes sp.]